MKVLNVNFTDPNAPAQLAKSVRETGFAILNQHPIPEHLIDKVYQDWQAFFSGSYKQDFLFNTETQDGFFPFETAETAKGHTQKDLKEFFHFYPWGQQPGESADSQRLFNIMSDLAATLLGWLEDDVPNDIANDLSMPLREMISNSPKTMLRIIHYPPLTGQEEPGSVRAAAHEDINLITLLPAATANGLQVLDNSGNWHDITCDYGNIVVNAADMLQMCTRGYYKSTTHRVTNPIGAGAQQSRLSMPLFLHPRPDVRLAKDYTAHQYLEERLKELGLK